MLLDPFVPGGQPFDNRAPRGEDLQRLCGLRPRQGDLRVPAHRVHSGSPPFEPGTCHLAVTLTLTLTLPLTLTLTLTLTLPLPLSDLFVTLSAHTCS